MAAVPFLVAPLHWGWSFSEAAEVFLTTTHGLLGVALAIIAAGIAGRMVARAIDPA